MRAATTADRQLGMLRRMVARRVFEWMLGTCVAGTLVLVAVGMGTRLPPYFMIAAFLAFVGLAIRQSAPHVRRAARAIDAPSGSETVSILIEIERDSDSDTCYARVPTAHATWRMQFRPLGWKPVEGRFDGEARYVADVAWPALVVVGDGIIVPSCAPKRIAAVR